MSPDALASAELVDTPVGPAFARRLPATWSVGPLGLLGHWIGGGTPSKSVAAYWTGGSVPWVSPKDMKSAIIRDTQDHITEAAVAGSATNFVPPNSVLMVMRSGILRHSFPVAVNVSRVTVNQDLRTLVPAEGIDPQYLAHYLRSIERQILHECAKDGTTVQSIEAPALERVAIPIAPAAEQRRIVRRLDELFAEVAEGEAALERAHRDLDTWRRALLKVAVTGELTRDWREAKPPTEIGADLLARIRLAADRGSGRLRSRRTERQTGEGAPPFDAPSGWAWASIGEITDRMDYGTSVKCGPEPLGVPVLRMGNIQEGEVDFQRLKYASAGTVEGLLLEDGDLLFNRTNSAELVGKTAIYRGRPAPCSFASYLVRLRVLGCDAQFVNAWLNSAYAKSWVASNKSQQVGQANLSAGKLAAMPVPIPPLTEQRVIMRRLRDHFEAADIGARSVVQGASDSAALRQSILKAAFEGRLVLQDPTDEPASALVARLRAEGGAGRAAPRRRWRLSQTGQRSLAL